jgi:hypothetical protein
MQLTDKLIADFINLYEKHFGVVLVPEEALKKGLEWCKFVELVENEPEAEHE